MTVTEMNTLLSIHSARATAIVPEGWQAPNGYTLRGPRGNKTVVTVDAMGNPNAFAVRLWLDGIAYGDRRKG